jgi:serine acetyltransferase
VKIPGGVLIGGNARIGTNAVVLVDVLDNCTTVKVPVVIIHCNDI